MDCMVFLSFLSSWRNEIQLLEVELNSERWPEVVFPEPCPSTTLSFRSGLLWLRNGEFVFSLPFRFRLSLEWVVVRLAPAPHLL